MPSGPELRLQSKERPILNRFPHHRPWFGRVAGAAAALGIMGAATFAGFGPHSVASAQASGCAGAQFSANAEQAAGVAFVDVGAGKTAVFVCITSSGFSGGQSQPITANGSLLNGCLAVDGLGTSVVSVFWERPDVKPGCPMVTRIDVGTSAPVTPTPATPGPTVIAPTFTPQAQPTTPATPAPSFTLVPGATPTAAATQPPAATATPRPATVVPPPATTAPPGATQPPATTQVVPRPPATGSGTQPGGSNNLPLFFALGLFAVAAAGAGFATLSRKRNR